MVRFGSVVEVIVIVTSLQGCVQAFWRLPCRGRAGLGRIDPLVDPGKIADHVHTIHGGNNFGFDTTAEDLLASGCTSCGVKQDKSAYWTPPLYFMYQNGTAEMVPQVGGMLSYYLLYSEGPQQPIQAFPPGFQMLAGDTNRRNFTCAVPEPPKSLWTGYEVTQPALEQKALGFNCLNYVDPSKTEGSLARHFLPDKSFMDANCVDGLRLELMFPSCWNGKDVDSHDHKSHMAYPDQVMTGICPSGFKTRVPSLFYETIWDTYRYKDFNGQFLLSNGDPTGYGYHGDFMAAWDSGVLQQAVDQCTNLSGLVQDCSLFDLQSDGDAVQCTFQPPAVLADDNPLGPRQGLPGNVPVQDGPEAATPLHAGVTAQSTNLAATSSYLSLLASSTAQTLVPTVQPSLAISSATDAYGGGIAVADFRTPSAAVVEQAITTPAPQITVQEEQPSFVTTMYSTKGNQAWEIFVEEQVVTVTAAPTPAAAVHRRHDHHRRLHHAQRR